MTQNKEEKIKNDYLQGMRYKDIFKKYNITLPDLKKIIRKYNLTRDKSQVLKGNKNAKNNKGGQPPMGNKNAVTTGEYESIFQDVLTDEEKDISRLEITIHEGKNRQVRRMCESVGRRVIALHRSKIGNIGVKDIELGKWRYLKDFEVKTLIGK